MDYNKYVREILIPDLVSKGKFDKEVPGNGAVTVEDIRVNAAGGLGEDHWASSTFFVLFDVRRGSQKATVDLVVKFVCPGVGFKDFTLVDEMARNEGRMYNSILPYFDNMWAKEVGGELTIYPKCYCAQLEDPILVVMRNLGSEGFQLSKEKTFLDKHHLFVTIKKIAIFHGLSYASKVLDPENFFQLAHLLRETHYVPEKELAHSAFHKMTVCRGLKLENEPFSDDEKAVFEKLKARLAEPFSIMREAANVQRLPEAEALSVVAHGDFLRNNMLFKYNEAGEAVDVRFFDFQTSRYTTPAFDLSLYIFMNCSYEVRKGCWDQIFKTYYDTLVSTVKQLGATEKDVPTLDAIKRDFARNGLSGYIICSFFLPIMLGPPKASGFDGTKELTEEEKETMHNEVLKMGGEDVNKILEDIIRDLVHLNKQFQ